MSSSSYKGSPFDVFQWERDLEKDRRRQERDRTRGERQRQGGHQLDLSERIDLGPDTPMGTSPPSQSLLQTPTISPAWVGRQFFVTD